jgi:multiple sugar transport system permease protein
MLCLVILLACIFIFPFFWMVTGSLKVQSAVQAIPPEWIPRMPTLNNYIRLFNNFPAWRWLFNSVFISCITTLFTLLFSSMAAYGYAKLYIPAGKFFFGSLIVTMMMPKQVILVPLFILVTRLGWQNTYTGLILPLIAWPYTVFLLRQSIKTIPREIFDAARMDGASEIDLYWRIVLPLSKPALGAVAIFAFINTWNDYIWQLVLITKREMATLPVAISTITTARSLTDYGLSMSGAVFAAIPMILIFFVFQGYFIKGITMGAVKG